MSAVRPIALQGHPQRPPGSGPTQLGTPLPAAPAQRPHRHHQDPNPDRGERSHQRQRRPDAKLTRTCRLQQAGQPTRLQAKLVAEHDYSGSTAISARRTVAARSSPAHVHLGELRSSNAGSAASSCRSRPMSACWRHAGS